MFFIVSYNNFVTLNKQDFFKMEEKKHGGKRKGAGRKPKADEEKVRKQCEDAIIKVYGSVSKYYEHLATESKDSFPHFKLLQEYYVGKPKETKDITINEIQPLFPDED